MSSLAPEWERIDLLGACLSAARRGVDIPREMGQRLDVVQQEVHSVRQADPWRSVVADCGLETLEPAEDGGDVGFGSSVFATCGMQPCVVLPGAEYGLVRVRYAFGIPEAPTFPIRAAIGFRDGLAGSEGLPYQNILTIEGSTYLATTRDLEVVFLLRPESPFIRSDSNGDGTLDISDAVTVLSFLFTGGSPPVCDDAADSNDDGALDISDASYVLNYLFLGGPAPPDPFGSPGEDPTADALDCRG